MPQLSSIPFQPQVKSNVNEQNYSVTADVTRPRKLWAIELKMCRAHIHTPVGSWPICQFL